MNSSMQNSRLVYDTDLITIDIQNTTFTAHSNHYHDCLRKMSVPFLKLSIQ